jgi:hypothetical protein
VTALTARLDRGLAGIASAKTPAPPAVLAAALLIAGPLYGAVMGSFALDRAERWLMVLFAAVKMPILLLGTTAVCLPGFFVLNSVLGLRQDFGRAFGAILSGQAALAVTLLSLAPVTRLCYDSGTTHRGAILFNAMVFLLATGVAQEVTRRRYRGLIAAHPNHRIALALWAILYAFVGIQMGWTLRPFIGAPGLSVSFFRPEPFSNAYVVVFRMVFGE